MLNLKPDGGRSMMPGAALVLQTYDLCSYNICTYIIYFYLVHGR